jgi:hypothetical protein
MRFMTENSHGRIPSTLGTIVIVHEDDQQQLFDVTNQGVK